MHCTKKVLARFAIGPPSALERAAGLLGDSSFQLSDSRPLTTVAWAICGNDDRGEVTIGDLACFPIVSAGGLCDSTTGAAEMMRTG